MAPIPLPPFSAEHCLNKNTHVSIPIHPHLALRPSIVDKHLSSNIPVDRLNELAKYLWMTGQPDHIQPLHEQLILRRKIFITDDPNLHCNRRGHHPRKNMLGSLVHVRTRCSERYFSIRLSNRT